MTLSSKTDLGHQSPDARLLAAPSDEQQRQPGHAARQPPHGLEEDLEALDGIPPADAADHEIVGADAQRLAPDGDLADDVGPSPPDRRR